MRYFQLSAIVLGLALAPLAGAAGALWQDVAESAISTTGAREIRPNAYRTVALDTAAMRESLQRAPVERTGGNRLRLSLPMPDGGMQRFEVEEAPLMAPELAAKYPEIRTYRIQGLDDVHASGRLDLTPAGFHALVLAPSGNVWIDPYQRGDLEHYLSYYRRDYAPADRQPQQCRFDASHDIHKPLTSAIAGAGRTPSGSVLRSYQLALATTGEYTSFHGGTVSAGLAAVVTAVNRVVGIYEAEVAIRMELIANNDQLIFTNAATDGYTNFNGATMLGENQAKIDSLIGSGNYDVGHVFSTGSGGIASLAVVCRGGLKARGVTGSSSPIGDPFYVDFVAHEFGHQFGSNHTFNGTAGSCGDNRNPGTAYEPGSGSTIMAYSGLCGSHNIQNLADPYFHTSSFDEIVAYTTSGFGTACDAPTGTGNSAPVVEAGPTYTIPADTPFKLTGSATDPNGDPLVFRWEQFDLGPGGSPLSPTGNAPLFRSYPAAPEPLRYFPRLVDILDDDSTIGEVLPDYDRNMVFRMTALDNRAGGGGVDYDSTSIEVTNAAGPFDITDFNTFGIVWVAGTQETVNWTVNNTDQAPVNCSDVFITLSLDAGVTFTEVVSFGTPNDGSHTFTVPNTPAPSARIQVQCANNIFLDINDRNVRIDPPPTPDFSIDAVEASIEVCAPATGTVNVDVGQIVGFTDPVTLSASGNPAGTGVTFSVNPVTPAGTSVLSLSDTALGTPGDYTLTVSGTASTGTKNDSVDLTLLGGAPAQANLTAPVDGALAQEPLPALVWDPVADTDLYVVQIATDASFTNIVYSANELGTSHGVTVQLALGTQYFWRVRAENACGGTDSVAFTFTTRDPPLIVCSTPSLAIPDSGGTSDSLTVPNTNAILDLNLRVTATHPYVGDLGFELFHDDTGTSALAVDRPIDPFLTGGCPLANIDVLLDDEAANPVELECLNADPTIGGTLSPNSALSVFDGESVAGTWTLVAADSAAGNLGTLDEWCIEVEGGAPLADSDGDGIPDASDNCTAVANADQRDTNGDGYGNLCDADLTNDGTIDFLDLGQMKLAFFDMGSGLDADLNGDLIVDFLDLGLIKQSFFGSPGPSALAP